MNKKNTYHLNLMKNYRISKIKEGGCNNTLLLYILYAVISSIITTIILIVVIVVLMGKVGK